jgi:hypothetical protein
VRSLFRTNLFEYRNYILPITRVVKSSYGYSHHKFKKRSSTPNPPIFELVNINLKSVDITDEIAEAECFVI